MITVDNAITRSVHRLEVFTGAGRRRTWSDEDKALRWPKIEDGVMRLSAAQLSALIEGLDWRRVHEARETVTPMQPG
jgi:transposase